MTRMIGSVSAVAAVVTVLLVAPVGARRAKTTALGATIANPPESSLMGDNLGSYPAAFSGGYFQLSLTTGRALAVNLGDCELNCAAPFPYPASVNAYNADQPLLNVLSQMEPLPVGSSISSRFRIRFRDDSGALWVLRYFGETETCGAETGTAMVSATRTTATEWTIVAPAGSVACLLRLQTVKGQEIATPFGRYRVPFSITATSAR